MVFSYKTPVTSEVEYSLLIKAVICCSAARYTRLPDKYRYGGERGQ